MFMTMNQKNVYPVHMAAYAMRHDIVNPFRIYVCSSVLQSGSRLNNSRADKDCARRFFYYVRLQAFYMPVITSTLKNRLNFCMYL